MTSLTSMGDFSFNGRSDALPPGTRLDEYEIGPVIGESPIGIVYLATDHSLGRKVAIREYLPSALSGRGDGPLVALRSAGMADAYRRGLRAFVEEARLLARFDDPSLLRVLRFWEAHFTAYIVMPYYDAPTLTMARERLEEPPAEPWIRSLVESLANSLELLHGESCLHRNLTPDRVLMLRDGRPMLLGPSAVRQVLGRTANMSLIQPGFSAIEEYAESSDLPQGPWTDVYALGAVARFCILGIPPVAATVRSVRDPLVGMHDALHPLRVQWPELAYSPSLLAAIDKSLEVDPARRPQSMAEFRELLRGPQVADPRGNWASPRLYTPVFVAAPDRPGAATVEGLFDPTRPEPDLHLLQASDLETADFEASLSAMVDEALIDAPPMRTQPPAPSTGESEPSIVRAASAGAMAARPDPSFEPDPPTVPLAVDEPTEPALGSLRDALPDDRTPFAPSPRPAWQRALTAVAAVLLIGAFGYVGWTQYLRSQDEDRVAARVPTAAVAGIETPAASAASAPDAIAEARLNPPAAGPMANATAASPPAIEEPVASASAAAAAETPAEATPAASTAEPPPPVSEPTAAEAAKAARAARREARRARAEHAAATASPQSTCAGRSEFGLYYCMKTQCEKPQNAGLSQCRQFKLQE